MNTIRAFFAITPPETLQAGLHSVLETLETTFPKNCLKWIDVSDLHITLQFLSEVYQNELAKLVNKANVALKNIPPFKLELGEVEWFPSLENPKILSLDVNPQDTLREIATSLGQALSALNYPVESRLFRGHMSLAKARRHHHVPYGLITKIKIPPIPPVLINKVRLIESKPNPGGGRSYHNVAEFNLTKSI